MSEARAFAAANSDPRRLDEAARLTRQTLALKPADATAWARLAWIASERGQSAEMADALDRSYGVAPFGPEITGWRLRFVYSQWSSLPPALRQQAAAELAVTARTRPRLARAVLADISHPAGRLAFTLRLRRAERERALATAT